MADQDYVVGARLELNAPTVLRSLSAIGERMSALGARISGTNSMFRNMVGSAVAFGGAYVGVRAVSSALAGVVRGGFAANAEMETMRLSLASIYGAVENQNLEQSLQGVSGLFDQLALAAAQSPAEFNDLVGIMNQIYGPLRTAGMAMGDMVDLTKNASAAGMALGISNDVMGSSMARLVRGAAGMENPLFSMLQSMGLITETTEEWNRQLTSAERSAKLAEAINRIGGESAEAFGQTWVGVSATFSDLIGIFKRTFMGSAFESIKNSLIGTSDALMQYRENIQRVMAMMGNRLGAVLTRAFGSAQQGFGRVLSNVDVIVLRMDQAIAKFMEIKPVLAEAGKMFLALQVGRGVLGPLISSLGFVATTLASIGGLFGAGAGAAAAGGAGAAAAGGAGAATLTAIGTAISAIAAPLALIAAAAAAVYVGFQQFSAFLLPSAMALGETFAGIGGDFMEIIGFVWDFIGPPISMLGGLIGGAVLGAFRLLAGVIRVVMVPLRLFGRLLGWVGDFLAPVFELIGNAFLTLFEQIGRLGDAFSEFVSWIFRLPGMGGGSSSPSGPGPTAALWAEMRAAFNGSGSGGAGAGAAPGAGTGNAPAGRGGTTVNMQGSRITVNQEFREADPDRVWISMRAALEREAVQRTQSGFANALTR